MKQLQYQATVHNDLDTHPRPAKTKWHPVPLDRPINSYHGEAPTPEHAQVQADVTYRYGMKFKVVSYTTKLVEVADKKTTLTTRYDSITLAVTLQGKKVNLTVSRSGTRVSGDLDRSVLRMLLTAFDQFQKQGAPITQMEKIAGMVGFMSVNTMDDFVQHLWTLATPQTIKTIA
jgi:hypothetical protein